MNERIRELAEQAYEQQPLMVANCETFEIEHKIGHGGAPMYHRVFNQEKFAELIVKECVGLCETAAYAPRPALNPTPVEQYAFIIGEGNMAVNLTKQIRKHFGVEE